MTKSEMTTRLRPAMLLGAAALMAMTGAAFAQARSTITVDEDMLQRSDARALVVTQLLEGTVAPPAEIVAIPQPQQPVVALQGSGPTETALLFPVQFAFGSAELSRSSMEILDMIADAIRSDPMLRSARFLVEGHTDSVGSWAYNKTLSEQRATAVADYLVARGLSPTQLISVGYSWNRLIPGLNPRHDHHRRVEIGRLE
ncbi:MAG: OmpA family protein [Pararhodobacter sp.]|nr:OmpA family protein [Pararhodobacter sp.]